MKAYPITVLCAVMEVSRSGFYDYLHRLNTDNPSDEYQNALRARIKAIFNESRGSYGSRRVLKKLQSEGHQLGRYKVRRLMRDLGLRVKRRRRYKVTTDSRHLYPVAANVLDRKFDVAEANRVWACDITYVWTLEGWLYLAAIMDLYSRQIVGWAMDSRIDQGLALDALNMALTTRRPAAGLVHHSDRGVQYAGAAYQEQLRKAGMVCSMSSKGDCWDNAVAESFFSTFKAELVHRMDYAGREQAWASTFDYIEAFYNQRRRHSALDYLSPAAFERQFRQQAHTFG